MALTMRKIPLVLSIITLVFFILNLAAPYMIEPNTVRGLEGRANAMDFQDKWDDMHPVPRAIYWFGDFNCHQYESRSFVLNENQLPVCSRCMGVFLGTLIGSMLLFHATPRAEWEDMGMTMLPESIQKKYSTKRQRTWFLYLMAGLFILPMGLDGTIQLVTDYESNNIIRLLTGTFFGIIVALAAGIFVESAVYFSSFNSRSMTQKDGGGG